MLVLKQMKSLLSLSREPKDSDVNATRLTFGYYTWTVREENKTPAAISVFKKRHRRRKRGHPQLYSSAGLDSSMDDATFPFAATGFEHERGKHLHKEYTNTAIIRAQVNEVHVHRRDKQRPVGLVLHHLDVSGKHKSKQL